jgi:hypothetical protein
MTMLPLLVALGPQEEPAFLLREVLDQPEDFSVRSFKSGK